eukprot:gnl/MRDRNA2_/MRDRNA2_139521_c0_seq1.p1 gnl/MRDRNA2_/MRDRNA2_139521_c0~~gnl/MRDRNA2_/MRDRNA2_139521_c0_seq1.p1  ORF type:complete len:307 (+),score=55.81 gnl/MRDRNA2_/MRDRNA2_139521_c0_seq1:131-1051(+)
MVRLAMNDDWEKVIRANWAADCKIEEARHEGQTLCSEPLIYTSGATATSVTLYGRIFWSKSEDACSSSTTKANKRIRLSSDQQSPGVIVFHTASGPHDLFLHWKCEVLAAQGFIVLCADMYGDKDGNGWEKEWNMAKREELENIQVLEGRALSAVEALQKYPGVDSNAIAALGFCLGGRVCLELARAAHPAVRCVVSLHGVLRDRALSPKAESKGLCDVLICHGDSDQVVDTHGLEAVLRQLRTHCSCWELCTYGGARHGFTNPGQTLNPNQEMFGYHEAAAIAAWSATERVLDRLKLASIQRKES